MEWLIFLPVVIILLMIAFVHACEWHGWIKDIQ